MRPRRAARSIIQLLSRLNASDARCCRRRPGLALAATAAAAILLSNATFAGAIALDQVAQRAAPPRAHPATPLHHHHREQQQQHRQLREMAQQETNQCLEAANATNGPRAAGDQQQQQHLYVKLSTFWYCFLAFITSLGLAVSLVSNMIIIYLFTGTPSLRRNPSNIIAVNLSLSDLLYCIQWPSVIYCSLTQSTWLLEIDYVCQIFGFITVITASASVLTVLAMSIERAIVIKYSIQAKSRFTMRHALLVVLLIWFISLASSLPPLFGTFNRFTLDPSKTSCTLDYLSSKTNYKLYTLVLYITYWIAPTIVISICYFLIMRTFARSSQCLKQAGKRQTVLLRRALVERDRLKRPTTSTGQDESGRGEREIEEGTQRQLTRLCSSELASRNSSGRWTSSSTRGDTQTDERTGPSDPSPGPPPSGAFESTGASSNWRHRRSRLRDSIRLHNFVGSLKASMAGSGRRENWSLVVARLSSHSRGDEIATQRRELPRGAPRRAQNNRWQVSTDEESRDATCEQLRASQATDSPPLSSSPEANSGPLASHHLHQADPQEGPEKANPEEGRASEGEQQPKKSSMFTRRKFGASSQRARFRHQPCSSLSGRTLVGAPTRPRRRISFDATRSRTFYELASCRELSSRRGPGGGGSGADGRDDQAETSTSATGSTTWAGTPGACYSSSGSRTNLASRVRSQLGLASTAPATPGGQLAMTKTTSTVTTNFRRRLTSSSCHFGNSTSHFTRTSMQIRLARMSFYLILLWLVSWTPIASLAMINSVVKCHHRASALAVFLANTMTKLGPAFDVFIYGISHPRIKKKFKLIIKWLFTFGSCRSSSKGSGAGENSKSASGRMANTHFSSTGSLLGHTNSLRSACHKPNASLVDY